MSDGGLLLSWNDSSHTTYMKEEVDRLVENLILTDKWKLKIPHDCVRDYLRNLCPFKDEFFSPRFREEILLLVML